MHVLVTLGHPAHAELVVPAHPCNYDRSRPGEIPTRTCAPDCACRTTFIGLDTRRTTTTAVVEDRPMTSHTLGIYITTSDDDRAGIVNTGQKRRHDKDRAAAIADFAKQHPVGTTVRCLNGTPVPAESDR